ELSFSEENRKSLSFLMPTELKEMMDYIFSEDLNLRAEPTQQSLDL
ncbi:DNA-processing protein DprA, partial [Salmonella enterica]|nr:DNA-processing protein DprA [Salmonella enterica]